MKEIKNAVRRNLVELLRPVLDKYYQSNVKDINLIEYLKYGIEKIIESKFLTNCTFIIEKFNKETESIFDIWELMSNTKLKEAIKKYGI